MAKDEEKKFIYWFSELGIKDVPAVGGKNASLGEMFSNLTSKGVAVPDGYAVSAYAYDYYIKASGIGDEMRSLLTGLDITNMDALASCGEKIRSMIRSAPLPKDLEDEINAAYDPLSEKYGG